MTEEERKKEFLWDDETNSGPSIKWDEKSGMYKEA